MENVRRLVEELRAAASNLGPDDLLETAGRVNELLQDWDDLLGYGAKTVKPPVSPLDGAMHSGKLHSNWRWLTSQMSTGQREAAADAVDRYSAALNGLERSDLDQDALRWWRE